MGVRTALETVIAAPDRRARIYWVCSGAATRNDGRNAAVLALNIAVQWALEQRRISAFEFRVLVTLARESVEVAPSEFACLIRHEDLGQRCEMSERAAQTALRNLVGKRLITIEPTFRANGKRGENRYTLATMS